MNNYTILPEIILAKFLYRILDWLDQETLVPEEQSYIAQVFKPFGTSVDLQAYNFFEQAKVILGREPDDARKIKIKLGYTQDKDLVPFLTINEETDVEKEKNIGNSEGLYNEEYSEYVEGSNFSSFREAEYTITIATDNVYECSLLHYLLKTVFLTFNPELHAMGLMDIEVSTTKINKYQGVEPENFFRKSLFLKFKYQHNAPVLYKMPIWDDMIFTSKIIK